MTVRAIGWPPVSVLLVLGLVALYPSGAAAAGDDEAAALSALRRARQAASELPFTGVQVVSTWSPVGTMTRMVEVRRARDGSRAVTVRRPGVPDAVTTTWPATDRTPAVDPLTLLVGAYRVVLGPSDEVAGRPTRAVRALRNGRLAAQLWLDDLTGMTLRQEVYDAGGRLVRWSGYLSFHPVDVCVPPQRAASTGSTTPLDATGVGCPGTGQMLSTTAAAPARDPAAEARELGAELPPTLPGGFRLVDVRRETEAGPGAGAVHLTYSNGLSGLSLFVQEGRLPTEGVPGTSPRAWGGTRVYLGSGWPTRAVWQAGPDVLTAVTDAPVDELREVVTVLPGGQGQGWVDRVSAVVRVTSALLPGR